MCSCLLCIGKQKHQIILSIFKLTFLGEISHLVLPMHFIIKKYAKIFDFIFSLEWSIQIPDSFVVKLLEIPKENILSYFGIDCNFVDTKVNGRHYSLTFLLLAYPQEGRNEKNNISQNLLFRTFRVTVFLLKYTWVYEIKNKNLFNDTNDFFIIYIHV